MRDNNAKYRPERFGGPSDEQMQIPHASFKDNRLRFFTPEDVAPIVLQAVRNDRPFVFDHSEQRASFREQYSDVIEACFDDIEQWEQEREGLREMPDQTVTVLRAKGVLDVDLGEVLEGASVVIEGNVITAVTDDPTGGHRSATR